MQLASRSLLTSSSMALYHLGTKFLFFCQTGLNPRSTFSLWMIISRGIIGIFIAIQVKTSTLLHKKSTNSNFVSSSKRLPIWTVFIESSSVRGIEIVFSSSSHVSRISFDPIDQGTNHFLIACHESSSTIEQVVDLLAFLQLLHKEMIGWDNCSIFV